MVEEQLVGGPVEMLDRDRGDSDAPQHVACVECQGPEAGPTVAYCGEVFVAYGEILTDVPAETCWACKIVVETGAICPMCGQ